MQRFLQLDPSWLRSGQTTSLLASVIEKDDVKDDRGGILITTIALTPPFEVEVLVEYEFGVGVEVEVGRGRGWWWAGALVDKNRVESWRRLRRAVTRAVKLSH